MGRKIFVTGGTGVVGAKLVFDLFEKGYQLTVLVRNDNSIENLTNTLNLYTNNSKQIIESIDWVFGNVMDKQVLFERITSEMDVYHCAAMVSFNPKNTNKLIATNVEGTANIVNACLENNVRKLCLVSSIGALGSAINGSKITINTPWLSTGKSPYSKSKHDSEMEVWRGIAEGLNAVIVNPAVILGAGIWGKSSTALFSKVSKGMKFYTQGSTGFVYVNDVCNAMIKLMESDISGERFILSSETISYQKIFDKIAQAINAEIPKLKAGKLLTGIAWRVEAIRTKFSKREPLISKYTHKTVHSKSDYDGSPIIERIAFKYTSIDEAIGKIAEMFLKSSK